MRVSGGIARGLVWTLVGAATAVGCGEASQPRSSTLLDDNGRDEPPPCLLPPGEEVNVLADVIHELFTPSHQLVVLRDRTTRVDEPILPMQSTLEFPGREEMIADFMRKNRHVRCLGATIPLELPAAFVNEDRVESFFRQRFDPGSPLGEPADLSAATAPAEEPVDSLEAGWERFYRAYPGAQGIATFSRVGFDAEQRRAVVYFANQSAPLAGSGEILLLGRSHGRWVIEERIILWVS